MTEFELELGKSTFPTEWRTTNEGKEHLIVFQKGFFGNKSNKSLDLTFDSRDAYKDALFLYQRHFENASKVSLKDLEAYHNSDVFKNALTAQLEERAESHARAAAEDAQRSKDFSFSLDRHGGTSGELTLKGKTFPLDCREVFKPENPGLYEFAIVNEQNNEKMVLGIAHPATTVDDLFNSMKEHFKDAQEVSFEDIVKFVSSREYRETMEQTAAKEGVYIENAEMENFEDPVFRGTTLSEWEERGTLRAGNQEFSVGTAIDTSDMKRRVVFYDEGNDERLFLFDVKSKDEAFDIRQLVQEQFPFNPDFSDYDSDPDFSDLVTLSDVKRYLDDMGLKTSEVERLPPELPKLKPLQLGETEFSYAVELEDYGIRSLNIVKEADNPEDRSHIPIYLDDDDEVNNFLSSIQKHFEDASEVSLDDVHDFNLQRKEIQAQKQQEQQQQTQQRENTQDIALARKAGYVQGVCECALVVSEDKMLTKKLLSEMGVTRDMAQKFAKPETFKEMEQSVYAQKNERSLEQGKHIKL